MTSNRGQHLIGTVLGSCVLERVIGYGGSSVVYIAQQHTPSRKVAVKVFLPRSTMDAHTRREFYRRFLREAEVASQLDHPNILPIYSYGEQDGLPYIIMPYISGGTLYEYIAQHGPLSLKEALWHLEQIASALDYSHARGCVHSDIKPANILLDGEQRIVLADFGIARISNESTLKLTGERRFVAESNALMGTPDYISPEQALGQDLDGRSDIYSLAILLFFLLAGELPFKADTSIALALMHVHDAPPSLCLWRADVSPVVDGVVHRALAKGKDERYQTPGAFSSAFAQALEIPFESKGMRKQASREGGNEREYALDSVLLVPKPVVQVKNASSLPRHTHFRTARAFFWTPRFAIVASVLLIVLVGTTAMATVLIGQRLAHGRSTTKVAVTPTPHAITSNENMLTDESNWPTGAFYFYDKQQQYHILNKLSTSYRAVLYNSHDYSDFRLTVTGTLAHGDNPSDDYYGVVIRAASNQSSFYLFEINKSPNGDYGQYTFYRKENDVFTSLVSNDVPSMHFGIGKSNTITIVAQGDNFTFFVDNKEVGKTVDTSKSALSTGNIGLYVEGGNIEVPFSGLFIQKLS